jgi:hypothetical protein
VHAVGARVAVLDKEAGQGTYARATPGDRVDHAQVGDPVAVRMVQRV